MYDAGLRARQLEHGLSQLEHGELAGIAEIDRACDVVFGIHQADEAVDQVGDIAEAAGLLSVAIERDVFAAQGLHDEIGDNPAIIRMHAWPISVEDPGDLDLRIVLAVIVEEQRFGAALALVIAGTDADRVHIAPVFLALRVHVRIAIDFRGRGLEDLRAGPLGEAQHVDGAMHACLRRLYGVELVMNRACRARHVVDLVDLHEEREGHVMAHDLEARVFQEVRHVGAPSGEEIIHAEDFRA